MNKSTAALLLIFSSLSITAALGTTTAISKFTWQPPKTDMPSYTKIHNTCIKHINNFAQQKNPLKVEISQLTGFAITNDEFFCIARGKIHKNPELSQETVYYFEIKETVSSSIKEISAAHFKAQLDLHLAAN